MRQRPQRVLFAERRELEAIFPSSAQNRRWNTPETAACFIRSGIMQALRELGLADSIYGERYHDLFGWNPRGGAPLARNIFRCGEVLATARGRCRGGVRPPTVYKSMPLLRELVREGMVDGIEVYHPSNSPEDKAECAAICAQYQPHPHRRHRLPRGQPQKGSTLWAPAPPPMTASPDRPVGRPRSDLSILMRTARPRPSGGA